MIVSDVFYHIKFTFPVVDKEVFSGGKSLLIKYTPREQAQKAIIDIIVLSSQKIRYLPEGYHRLQ